MLLSGNINKYDEMKKGITELRIKIDGLSQLVKGLRPFENSTNKELEYLNVERYFQPGEINKSYDSLILAKAWLGKVLGELGQDTPYKNDGNRKTKEDIEETADKTSENNPTKDGRIYEQRNHIEKIDWLREEIKKLINLNPKTWDRYKDSTIIETYFLWSFKYLSEARFWLGFELQRIKEGR